MRMMGGTCMKTRTPGTVASFGRSPWITSSALGRSARGRRWRNIRPWLSVDPVDALDAEMFEQMTRLQLERHALGGFDDREHEPLILVRDEALRDVNEEEAGHGEERERHAHGRRAMAEHPGEAPLVAAQHGVEGALGRLEEAPVPRLGGRAEVAGAQHRGG